MKRLILLSALLGLFACQDDPEITGTNPNPNVPDPNVPVPNAPVPPAVERKNIELTKAEWQIVERNNLFAFDLLRTVSKNEEKENILISPLSASLALAMLNNGANGLTHEEIQSVLGYGDITRDEMNGYFQKMLEAMQEIDPLTTFKSANSIWIEQQFPVLAPFTEVNKDYYGAEIRNEDFADPATVSLINNWCSDNTEGKIPEILDDVSAASIMYLINALYFKAIWTVPFDKANTKDETFYNLNGKTPLIPTMNNELEIYCSRGDDFTTAELPYGNEAFSMVFLLPDEGVSLSSIIEKLDVQTWKSSTDWMNTRKIPIKIPRFKIEYTRTLNNDLMEMGMQSMFTSADFSLINPTAKLSVSLVLQKTFAEVNEEGTEAATITIIGMIGADFDSPPRPEIKEFYVDRPFLYFIKEQSTGTIFFIGEMRNMNPE
ncbi:MAG: serpin family protein [Tannerellaceae bacterium]|jgi:serpin B|nr:serpin family protein [Tannerellaceae bacterium]